jgi:hypothetical protein
VVGFDQKVSDIGNSHPDDLALRQRIAYPGAKSILDTLDSPGGFDWWKANGSDLYHMVFDLTPGSRSMRRFEAKLAAHVAKATAPRQQRRR